MKVYLSNKQIFASVASSVLLTAIAGSGLAAQAESEAMSYSGTESGGVFSSGSNSESGGYNSNGGNSQSGGVSQIGANSQSGGAFGNGASTQSGGALNSAASNLGRTLPGYTYDYNFGDKTAATDQAAVKSYSPKMVVRNYNWSVKPNTQLASKRAKQRAL